MKKAILIILILFYISKLTAQQFRIEMPNTKRVEEFTYNLINILNDAPFNFSHIKGKLITKTDTVHLKSDIYHSKINLPGAVAARYVQDSTKYVEYFFGEFDNIDEAKEAFEALTKKVSKSLAKRVVTLTNDWGNDANTVIENKLAYTFHNGFFHYNISLQVNKVIKTNFWRVVLQVYSGRPNYYNWIMKNEPIGSFNFVKIMKGNIASLYKENLTTCPLDLPPFICVGPKKIKDTSYIIYDKTGFSGLLNARSEFDAFFGAVRAGLGSEYVYFIIHAQTPVLRKVAFIKFSDIDNGKRKTIYLSLAEKPNANNTNPYKKEYEIQLSFGY